MFKVPEGGKVVETGSLSYASTDVDEVNINVQKVYGVKDIYGTLSSANPPIPIAAQKPLLSYMDSRYFLPTKTASFSS